MMAVVVILGWEFDVAIKRARQKRAACKPVFHFPPLGGQATPPRSRSPCPLSVPYRGIGPALPGRVGFEHRFEELEDLVRISCGVAQGQDGKEHLYGHFHALHRTE